MNFCKAFVFLFMCLLLTIFSSCEHNTYYCTVGDNVICERIPIADTCGVKIFAIPNIFRGSFFVITYIENDKNDSIAPVLDDLETVVNGISASDFRFASITPNYDTTVQSIVEVPVDHRAIYRNQSKEIQSYFTKKPVGKADVIDCENLFRLIINSDTINIYKRFRAKSRDRRGFTM